MSDKLIQSTMLGNILFQAYDLF